jgi:hypothetical protein
MCRLSVAFCAILCVMIVVSARFAFGFTTGRIMVAISAGTAGATWGTAGRPSFVFGRHDKGVLFLPTWRFGSQINWIAAPLWPLAILSLATGATLRRLDRRARVALCHNCNYDLAGNTGGVCPECGTAIPEAASAPQSQPGMSAPEREAHSQ